MRFLVLLLLVGTALAAPQAKNNRVVGGSDTTIEAYPFMANLQRALLGIIWYSACGGSLITSSTILSAAHCFDGDTTEEWRARLGSTVADVGTLFTTSQIIMHADYNRFTMDHDVAILRLTAFAPLGSNINIARIAGPAYDSIADNTLVTTVGWGDLQSGGPSATTLQHVDLDVINQQLCYQRYTELPLYPDISEFMICAGVLDVGGRDACQGDSGGPLLHGSDVVIGIVSWGYGCADSYWPGVNVRVSKYTDWIYNNGSV